ncbi:nucleotidyltransferase domain-containing protein [Dokdonella soli]|uniref:Polymerase nucleotidyl transferase domain-containing protein n=1 Tax=Dokdonella soli TaxID=529810 RepID=A0ABP3TNJ8_9GAMM
MLGITQYLACHRISMDTIQGYVRPLGDGECLLLVGSVAEGLANPESDLDLLLLANDRDAGEHELHGDMLRAMPEGFDLNIEVITHARAEAVCRFFLHNLNEARRPAAAGAPRSLTFVGADELRLLHRLRTGIPLIASANSVDTLRDCYALHALPDFCTLQHVACHLRLRADASQTVQDAGDPHTPLVMSQLAGQHLIAAVLASIGETNPNPKWLLRLLRDHRRMLQTFDPDRLIRLALPGAASSARDIVDELQAVSEMTLARLVIEAGRAGSPTAVALSDLLPRHPRVLPAEPVDCVV